MPSMFKMKLRVGSYTGDQAFSTWLRNSSEKILKESERRMFKAAGFCRTDMRQEFPRKRKAKQGYKGYNWASHPPSTPPKAPRRRVKGKAGLQYVTFKQVKRFEFRIGPDMSVSYGAKTKFDGDIVHARGGNNKEVKLPLHIDQIPSNMVGPALEGTIKWPMAFKKCHYRKRDYLSDPARETTKKFTHLFANLTVRG